MSIYEQTGGPNQEIPAEMHGPRPLADWIDTEIESLLWNTEDLIGRLVMTMEARAVSELHQSFPTPLEIPAEQLERAEQFLTRVRIEIDKCKESIRNAMRKPNIDTIVIARDVIETVRSIRTEVKEMAKQAERKGNGKVLEAIQLAANAIDQPLDLLDLKEDRVFALTERIPNKMNLDSRHFFAIEKKPEPKILIEFDDTDEVNIWDQMPSAKEEAPIPEFRWSWTDEELLKDNPLPNFLILKKSYKEALQIWETAKQKLEMELKNWLKKYKISAAHQLKERKLRDMFETNTKILGDKLMKPFADEKGRKSTLVVTNQENFTNRLTETKESFHHFLESVANLGFMGPLPDFGKVIVEPCIEEMLQTERPTYPITLPDKTTSSGPMILLSVDFDKEMEAQRTLDWPTVLLVKSDYLLSEISFEKAVIERLKKRVDSKKYEMHIIYVFLQKINRELKEILMSKERYDMDSASQIRIGKQKLRMVIEYLKKIANTDIPRGILLRVKNDVWFQICQNARTNAIVNSTLRAKHYGLAGVAEELNDFFPKNIEMTTEEHYKASSAFTDIIGWWKNLTNEAKRRLYVSVTDVPAEQSASMEQRIAHSILSCLQNVSISKKIGSIQELNGVVEQLERAINGIPQYFQEAEVKHAIPKKIHEFLLEQIGFMSDALGTQLTEMTDDDGETDVEEDGDNKSEKGCQKTKSEFFGLSWDELKEIYKKVVSSFLNLVDKNPTELSTKIIKGKNLRMPKKNAQIAPQFLPMMAKYAQSAIRDVAKFIENFLDVEERRQISSKKEFVKTNEHLKKMAKKDAVAKMDATRLQSIGKIDKYGATVGNRFIRESIELFFEDAQRAGVKLAATPPSQRLKTKGAFINILGEPMSELENSIKQRMKEGKEFNEVITQLIPLIEAGIDELKAIQKNLPDEVSKEHCLWFQSNYRRLHENVIQQAIKINPQTGADYRALHEAYWKEVDDRIEKLFGGTREESISEKMQPSLSVDKTEVWQILRLANREADKQAGQEPSDEDTSFENSLRKVFSKICPGPDFTHDYLERIAFYIIGRVYAINLIHPKASRRSIEGDKTRLANKAAFDAALHDIFSKADPALTLPKGRVTGQMITTTLKKHCAPARIPVERKEILDLLLKEFEKAKSHVLDSLKDNNDNRVTEYINRFFQLNTKYLTRFINETCPFVCQTSGPLYSISGFSDEICFASGLWLKLCDDHSSSKAEMLQSEYDKAFKRVMEFTPIGTDLIQGSILENIRILQTISLEKQSDISGPPISMENILRSICASRKIILSTKVQSVTDICDAITQQVEDLLCVFYNETIPNESQLDAWNTLRRLEITLFNLATLYRTDYEDTHS